MLLIGVLLAAVVVIVALIVIYLGPDMASVWKPREFRPLSNWAIALGAVIVLGIGATAWILLLWRYAGAGPGVELDAIRAASTLTVAAGGAAALLLAARRQRSTELTLEHHREVARATNWDAVEWRITELYIRAVDQLGAEKAPVRLGGLHALERLAQNNPDQRQTIVDVICSYLRMPYTPPDDQAPGEDAPEDTHCRYEQRRQELQVRLTAQRILTAHLNPRAAKIFWAGIDLNLTEARLHQLYLTGCQVRGAQFGGAQCAKDARVRGAKFYGDYAGFRNATFAGYAVFEGAEFTADGEFGGRSSPGRSSRETRYLMGRSSPAQGSSRRRSPETRVSSRRGSPETQGSAVRRLPGV